MFSQKGTHRSSSSICSTTKVIFMSLFAIMDHSTQGARANSTNKKYGTIFQWTVGGIEHFCKTFVSLALITLLIPNIFYLSIFFSCIFTSLVIPFISSHHSYINSILNWSCS